MGQAAAADGNEAAADRNEVGCAVLSAAERFCTSSSVNSTSKRLLYEFLALLGPDGSTLSGLSQSADAKKKKPGEAQAFVQQPQSVL
jgi:hypothetical protein